jgi:hypothetical protein
MVNGPVCGWTDGIPWWSDALANEAEFVRE